MTADDESRDEREGVERKEARAERLVIEMCLASWLIKTLLCVQGTVIMSNKYL